MDIWTSEHDDWMSVDYYFDMIGRKTASLIAGSAQAGAMLATEDPAIVAAYRRFGWALGIAFQLNDDLLGIWGNESTTGKEASDIATRKKTLPLLYGLEHASGPERDRLAALIVESDLALGDDETDEVRGILERVGARDYTREQARSYRDEALREIRSTALVDPDAIDRLDQIVRGTITA